MPKLERSEFEDAFDEIELIGFPISCNVFDLLKSKFRGTVLTNDFTLYDKKVIKLVGYLISRKDVPTKRGLMHFGTWIDAHGAYFDTTHFPDSIVNNPFQGGGCYLLKGKIDVRFSFASLVVERMAKLPFIADPRFADGNDVPENKDLLKTDVSTTHRAPYPSTHEIGLPRYKMGGK